METNELTADSPSADVIAWSLCPLLVVQVNEHGQADAVIEYNCIRSNPVECCGLIHGYQCIHIK